MLCGTENRSGMSNIRTTGQMQSSKALYGFSASPPSVIAEQAACVITGLSHIMNIHIKICTFSLLKFVVNDQNAYFLL